MTIALATLSFCIGLVGTFVTEQLVQMIPFLRSKLWVPHLLFGYHIHYSVVGLLCVIIGLMLIPQKRLFALCTIAFGIGIIVVHSISDGRLIFIE